MLSLGLVRGLHHWTQSERKKRKRTRADQSKVTNTKATKNHNRCPRRDQATEPVNSLIRLCDSGATSISPVGNAQLSRHRVQQLKHRHRPRLSLRCLPMVVGLGSVKAQRTSFSRLTPEITLPSDWGYSIAHRLLWSGSWSCHRCPPIGFTMIVLCSDE